RRPPLIVAGVHGDLPRVLLYQIAVGHPVGALAQIQQLPWDLEFFGLSDHRQHGGNANPSGDKPVIRGRRQSEVVTWPAETHDLSQLHFVVNFDRAAGAIVFSLDGNAVLVRRPTVATQRILADLTAG